MNDLSTYLLAAAPLAAVVVAIVAAVRSRVPSLDGWRVLVVAAGVALLLAAILLRPATLAAAWDLVTYAALAWAIAVGGDSWVARIVAKASPGTVVVEPSAVAPREHVIVTRGQP